MDQSRVVLLQLVVLSVFAVDFAAAVKTEKAPTSAIDMCSLFGKCPQKWYENGWFISTVIVSLLLLAAIVLILKMSRKQHKNNTNSQEQIIGNVDDQEKMDEQNNVGNNSVNHSPIRRRSLSSRSGLNVGSGSGSSSLPTTKTLSSSSSALLPM